MKSDEDDGDGVIAVESGENSLSGDNDESMISQSNKHFGDNASNESDSENSEDDQQKIYEEYKNLLEQVNEDNYAYNKYVRLCELSQ